MVGYDVKLRLIDMEPITWRDIIIPGGISSHELHQIIQEVFGFYDGHLYAFTLYNHQFR